MRLGWFAKGMLTCGGGAKLLILATMVYAAFMFSFASCFICTWASSAGEGTVTAGTCGLARERACA